MYSFHGCIFLYYVVYVQYTLNENAYSNQATKKHIQYEQAATLKGCKANLFTKQIYEMN